MISLLIFILRTWSWREVWRQLSWCLPVLQCSLLLWFWRRWQGLMPVYRHNIFNICIMIVVSWLACLVHINPHIESLWPFSTVLSLLPFLRVFRVGLTSSYDHSVQFEYLLIGLLVRWHSIWSVKTTQNYLQD